jgi:hypothetical protein
MRARFTRVSASTALLAFILLTSTIPASAATDNVPPDPQSGGIVIVVGFILVGTIAVVVAARLAKKSREE